MEDASSDDNGQDLSMYNFSQDGFAPHDMGYHHHVRGSVDWMRKMAFRLVKVDFLVLAFYFLIYQTIGYYVMVHQV